MICNKTKTRLLTTSRAKNRISTSVHAAMSTQYDTLDTIEVDERSAAPTKVLSTYGGLESSRKNFFCHAVLVGATLFLGTSLCLAYLYVPALSLITDYKIDRGDKCWVTSTTRCENNLKASIYFWNITNPSQVLAGTHPPALVEVGPYVMSNTVNKRQNITFSNDDTEVSFVSTLYADMDAANFCDGCSMNDEIVSFNLAYIGMVKTAGSEANILYTAIPQTLSGLVGGITQLFGAMASDPTLGAAFPNLVAAALGGPTALQALAVEQIFTASPLGGLSVTQLAALGVPAAFLTGFPSVPEYASWAATQASQPVSVVAISSPTSSALYQAVVGDSTGMTAVGMLTMDTTTLAATFTISALHAQLWKGYLTHISSTYGANAFQASLGPALGPQSSGMLIKRTVREWIFGYEDPVVSAQYAANDPRRLIRSVTKIRNATTIDDDHVPWSVNDTSTWAYVYGSTPYRIATGVNSPENATNVLRRSDGAAGPITYPHTSHVENVVGKTIASGQYHAIKIHGSSVDVVAWADFGMGLDLKRSLTLRHQQGKTVKKNSKVSVETYAIAHEEFLACPVDQTACGRNTEFHGTFNVSGFELIPSVYTLPHGHRADPRVFGGYIDPTSSSSPFAPNATIHDIEIMIYERSGNTVGMRVPIQQNFKIDPTDTFYTTLWSGASSGDEALVPISWTSLEYDMDEAFYDEIKETIDFIEILVAVWRYVSPIVSLCLILVSGVTLYVRRALDRRLIDGDRYAMEAVQNNSRAMQSFSDKNLVSALKKKNSELDPNQTDAAPASATKVAFAV